MPAPAPAPAKDPAGPYEEARSALKALGLPAKKYAYFLRRAEEAIASGKSYAPTVARARRAVEKLQAGSKRDTAAKPAARKPETRPESSVHTAIDRFNAAPGWRIQQLRPRANGAVLVVYPEGQDADAAVAAIDVVHENIDEVRWLGDGLTATEQDTILERVEQALWDADDADHGEDADEAPSPLQALIDLMQRRSSALGAQPTTSQNLGRTDGYPQIAEALRDLASPSGISADELQRWLEAENLMDAGEVIGRSRGADSIAVRQLMREVWDGRLRGAPGRADRREARGPERIRSLNLPRHRCALRARAGPRGRARGAASGPGPRRRSGPRHRHPDDRGCDRSAAARRRGPPGRARRAFFIDLYEKLGAFHDDLVRAPKTLQDVRDAALLGRGDARRAAVPGRGQGASRRRVHAGEGVPRHGPAPAARGSQRRRRAANARGHCAASAPPRPRSPGAAPRVRSTSASRRRTCGAEIEGTQPEDHDRRRIPASTRGPRAAPRSTAAAASAWPTTCGGSRRCASASVASPAPSHSGSA